MRPASRCRPRCHGPASAITRRSRPRASRRSSPLTGRMTPHDILIADFPKFFETNMHRARRRMQRLRYISCAIAIATVLVGTATAQDTNANATSETSDKNLGTTPREFKALKYRSIGPAAGGRVSRAAGVIGDPSIYYAATASGGVWKSSDGGATWKAVFDDQPISSIGSLAVGGVMASRLYGVGASDPLTLATGSVVVLLVAAAASAVPAMRAASVAPADALRRD